VLDLSGALDQETGVLVRAPWLGSERRADLFTPAVVPAHPAALALALLLERLQQAAPVRFAAATLLEPASEFGRAAMDELHQQTVSLLSFQGLPRAIRRAGGLQPARRAGRERQGQPERGRGAGSPPLRRAGAGRWPALALQVVHAPVFHGHTFSIAVELERPVEIAALEEALSGDHVDLVLEDTDSPSNLAATGQNDVLVRLRPELGGARNPTPPRACGSGPPRQSAPERAECRGVRAGPAPAAAAGDGAVPGRIVW
jgi:aspartate-semialdehyde dehydrogenase